MKSTEAGVDKQATEIEIQSHVDRGNYHAAINIAISAVNECRRNEDQAGVDAFLVVIRAITQKMSEEFGGGPD